MSESQAHLLALIHRLLASFEAQALAPFLVDWPVLQDAGSDAPPSADAASALPVLRWLPQKARLERQDAARPDAAQLARTGGRP